MRIEIFDVGHGHCMVLTAPNGRRMMLDCGQRWDERTFWTPGIYGISNCGRATPA